MPTYARKDFLRNYEFPLHPAQDFAVDGISASYVLEHPRQWGAEREAFDFLRDLRSGNFDNKTANDGDEGVKRELSRDSFSAALSSDSKLLAISSGYPDECILIYDVETKELRQVLDGCGVPVFRPSAKRHDDDEEGGRMRDDDAQPGYVLVSKVPSSASHTKTVPQLVLWELDRNGRLLVEEELIDPSAVATKAIEAIAPMLESEHEWSREFVTASNMHADFAKALAKASADHRRRHNTVFDNAELGGFLTKPFSSDGRLLLYVVDNHTTQNGMREADALPHVVVYDVDAGREVHRLGGHKDRVSWAGFSPDGQYIGSVSWDGTLRVYSSQTGEQEWMSAGSGSQAWVGAFSPDSQYIAWSLNKGRQITVLRVADGKMMTVFPEAMTRWCRCLAWHPKEQQLALCADTKVYVWRPFDGPEGSLIQRWVMDEDENHGRMTSVMDVSWMADGRLLRLTTSEGTTVVYDTATNAKEVFKRTGGAEVGHVKPSFYKLPGDGDGDEEGTYLSIDGDGQVRYWDRSVAPRPYGRVDEGPAISLSWWEKRVEEGRAGASPKSGKRIHVVRMPKKGGESLLEPQKAAADSSDSEQEAWAEKGAGVWTAE